MPCSNLYLAVSYSGTNQLMVFFSIHNSNGFSLKKHFEITNVFNIHYLTQMPVDQSFVYDPYFANKETDFDNLRNCSKSQTSSVQLFSCVQLFVTQRTTARQAPLSITNSWSLLKFMSIKSEMPSKHLILCRPLLLLPSIFPASRSLQMSQFFPTGGQSIGASA